MTSGEGERGKEEERGVIVRVLPWPSAFYVLGWSTTMRTSHMIRQ